VIIDGVEVTPAPAHISVNNLLRLWDLPNRIACPCEGCKNGWHITYQDAGWLFGAPTFVARADKCGMCDDQGMVPYLSAN
jgi:hypothetical protein